MEKSRLIYLDIAAGIMTIWVMVFHAIYPIFGTDELDVIPWFYYFMPWFFYKSGMMFQPKDMRDEVRSGWKKLIVTFIIWSFIGWLAHIGWHWFAGDLTPRVAFYSPLRSLLLKAEVPLNGALWFLPILWIVRLIGNWMMNKRVRVEFVIVGAFLCAIAINILNYSLMPTWISATAWGLFFFYAGVLLKDHETNKWVVGISALVFIASLFTSIPSVYCKSEPFIIQLLWYPACVAGCVTFNNVCRGLEALSIKLLPNGKDKYVFAISKYVGANAMNFYVPHKIIFHIGFNLIIWYKEEWYSTWHGLCIVLCAYAVILPIINWIINGVKVERVKA